MRSVSHASHTSPAAPPPTEGTPGGTSTSSSSHNDFETVLNNNQANSSPQNQALGQDTGQHTPGSTPTGRLTGGAAGIQNGASLLGEGTFSHGQPGKMTPETISGAHAQLQSNGYLFAGWHGTSKPAAESMVNGNIQGTKYDGDQKLWSGLYTGHNINFANRYTVPKDPFDKSHEAALLRVYVKDGSTQHVFATGNDIKQIEQANLPADVKNGTGNYVLSGPEEVGGLHEAVISSGLLSGGNTVAIPSLHGTSYDPKMMQPTLTPHTGEAQSIGPNLLNRNRDLASSE